MEHPVTEMITGLDLVELQIRVAQGEKLPKQKGIKMEGYAVEARLYAEDPTNDFLPTSGKILCLDDLSAEKSGDCFRIDAGYESPGLVGIHYDPMIAKIIGFGDEREEAIANCWDGIDEIEVWPLKTNSAFLMNVLTNDDFINANLSTHFIEDHIENLRPIKLIEHDEIYGLAAIHLYYEDKHSAETPFANHEGWRLNSNRKVRYTFDKNGEPFAACITEDGPDFWKVKIEDREYVFLLEDGASNAKAEDVLLHYYDWDTKTKSDYVSLHRFGNFVQVPFFKAARDLLASGRNAITAPMPGKIIALNVAAGDSVSKDDPLVVMEAMKMEQTLTAPRDGVIAEIGAGVGELVTDGAILVQLEEE